VRDSPIVEPKNSFDALTTYLAQRDIERDYWKKSYKTVSESGESHITMPLGKNTALKALPHVLEWRLLFDEYDIPVKLEIHGGNVHFKFKNHNDAEYAFLILHEEPHKALTEEQLKESEGLKQTNMWKWLPFIGLSFVGLFAEISRKKKILKN